MVQARILVVEDEMVISMHIRSMVTRTGHSVCGKASSGREAIDKAREMRPDLVLMDVVLQGDMDGIEAAEYIHASFSIPVVFLSGCADGDTLKRAKDIGQFAYLNKPFSDRELDSAIRMTVHKYGLEGQRKNEGKAAAAGPMTGSFK